MEKLVMISSDFKYLSQNVTRLRIQGDFLLPNGAFKKTSENSEFAIKT
jgi:hypothetical protein